MIFFKHPVSHTPEWSNIRQDFKGSFDIVHDFNYRGIYLDFWVGIELCRRYGLTKLEEELCSWKGVPQEPVKEPELSEPMKEPGKEPLKRPTKEPVKEPELSEFIEITGFSSPVMVRRSDLRVNASHIAKLIGYLRTAVANLRDGLNTEVYEILRGNRKRQVPPDFLDFRQCCVYMERNVGTGARSEALMARL